MERRGHHLVVELGEPVELDADHDRLIQVFVHLLDNAAKYTDPGGRLRIAIVRGDVEVEVRVQDDGRGISAPLLAQIFEPFVQDERTGARTPGGLGLGLAIVRGITRLHGGSVTAESDGAGTGSTFVVHLPLPPVAPPIVAGAAARVTKVLVVDDNLDAATLLADGLASLGHQAQVAADGPTALELVETLAPDVAVIDLGMPVMDGFELSRRLRSLPQLGRMRHIALTGYSAARDRLDTDAAGFDVHLVKPVTLEQVARAIEALAAATDEPSSSDGNDEPR
jgi:CheY-like chemotaxis protein